ncbi:methionine ABC transporter ATP-binding protein [Chitinibacter fontanus]|uniref:Cell division ATP-binding protein FtsE n=1 Tax=Chitinibacter fontanus TaxID=1737446 RepID=A0A7D5Z998_9NEIS|nr:methionine ABC transporter ATP-binding protein [Chitinibacter fontanus]QLI82863.1 methionine ABC transporter ATP-binding protein [Chitinibacter fontanus]
MILLENLSKSYRVDGRDIPALKRIDLSIAAGEIFGVIGHSGAGKSTLIRLINLLERPSGGRVLLDGVNLTELSSDALRKSRQKIGMIFQHFNLLMSKTVAQNVAFPLQVAGELDKTAINQRVAELLELVGLADHANKYPAQLSGGQKQRVGIARALANNPKLLLCDEATSALDPQTTASVLQLLLEINQKLKLTIVLITHEMNVIRSICDRVAVIDGGEIVELGPVTNVFLHPKHPTTRRFVYESEHVDETTEADDFAHVPGKIVRLTFKGESTYQSHLSALARQYAVDFSILAGRIERIKTTPCGQLTLGLVGSQVDELLSRLADEGIVVEELRQ